MAGQIVLSLIVAAGFNFIGFSSKICMENEYYSSNGTCLSCGKCGCQSDKYFDDLTQTCLHCTLAKPGEIYLKNCTPHSNAEVGECANDNFAFKNVKCMNCTICNYDELLVRDCTSSSDTVCKKKKAGKSDTLAITLSIVGPIVVLLIIGFGCWWRRKSTNINNNINMENYTMGSCSQRVNPLVDHQEEEDKLQPMREDLNPKRSGYQRASSQISQSSITSGYVDALADGGSIRFIKTASNQTIKWKKHDMSSLSWGCRDDLARLLTPQCSKDWRCVADALGFTNNQIKLLDMETGIESARQMLNEYDTFEGSSIPNLYKAFEKVERYDACKVLENFNKELPSHST